MHNICLSFPPCVLVGQWRPSFLLLMLTKTYWLMCKSQMSLPTLWCRPNSSSGIGPKGPKGLIYTLSSILIANSDLKLSLPLLEASSSLLKYSLDLSDLTPCLVLYPFSGSATAPSPSARVHCRGILDLGGL